MKTFSAMAAMVFFLFLETSGLAAKAPSLERNLRVQVEGSAVILRNNEARAQQRAIRNAFRNALLENIRGQLGEKGLAMYRKEIDASLLRLTSRYIHSYRFLHREVKPADRLMKVRLEVVVDAPALGEALRALQLAVAKKQDVRILFLVEERILGSGARRETALKTDRTGAAEERLMLAFARAGYTVVNPRAQREPAQPGQIGAAIRGDMDAARFLGGLCACRLVVTARGVAERERSGAFVGLVNARVIRVDDGSVIVIRSKQVRLRLRNRFRGHETVLAVAGKRLGNVLLPEVRRAYPPPRRRRRTPSRAGGGARRR